MIISQKLKLIYLQPHKTAGEEIHAALSEFTSPSDVRLPRGTLFDSLGPLTKALNKGLHKHSSAEDVAGFVGREKWGHYLKVATVRHPFARVESFYRYIGTHVKNHRYAGRRARLLRALKLEADPKDWLSFQAFERSRNISEFIRDPKISKIAPLNPMTAVLCNDDGALMVDVLLRVETLQADFDELLKRLDLPRRTLGQRNKSINPADKASLLSREDKELLQKRMHSDFIVFGYQAAD